MSRLLRAGDIGKTIKKRELEPLTAPPVAEPLPESEPVPEFVPELEPAL